MRALGIAIISLIPFALGVWQYNIIKRRQQTLWELEQLVLLIKEQMRFSLKEIDALLCFAYNQPHFSAPVKDMIMAVKGKTSHKEILEALQSVSASGITKKEISLLADFFAGLGQSDIKGQLEHCAYYREQLESINNLIFKEQGEKSRLWLGLSISLSLAVFVLLI